MAKGFKHGAGGGGASLNFKVVGNPQPENPKENTIWVNTDVEITDWIFSASEPENPTEGMVWFSTATSSYVEFNALKKNGITVYPLYTMQYVNGAWIEVTAKLWQNSEWVDLIMEFLIYENGVQYHKLEISGYSGWFESDHIAMQSKNATTYIRTSEKIGLKGMNTVTVDYNGKVSGASLTVAITDGTNDITIKNITSPDSGSISCDISSVSGTYYIEVRLWKSTYADVKITRIHVGRKLG